MGDLDGTFILAFRGFDDDEALLFQLAPRFDAQDALLGLDSYSISTGTGHTVYGGLVDVRFSGAVVTLAFRDDTATELGLDVEVSLALPHPDDVDHATAAFRRLGVTLRPG